MANLRLDSNSEIFVVNLLGNYILAIVDCLAHPVTKTNTPFRGFFPPKAVKGFFLFPLYFSSALSVCGLFIPLPRDSFNQLIMNDHHLTRFSPLGKTGKEAKLPSLSFFHHDTLSES